MRMRMCLLSCACASSHVHVHVPAGAKLVGAIFDLTKLSTLPPKLVTLLWRARLGGVGIENDITKLTADRLALGTIPPGGGAKPPNVTELSTLARDVLRLNASQVSSLEKVLARSCAGRTLNKKLVDPKVRASPSLLSPTTLPFRGGGEHSVASSGAAK